MKNDYEFIDGTRLSSVIEALIFASTEPVPPSKIRDIIVENEEQIEVSEETVQDFVDKLNERYDENGLSFRIERLGGGFTFVTQSKYHYWLSIFQHENAYRKLSQSAIESLAIIAYRQPITKPEVDQIRGVDSGYIIRQLLEKALIEVSGRADSPGKPLLYKTSKYFLQHFGINSVDELPKPREIEEILKDDDMAEHRQLLMDRQLMLEETEENETEPVKLNFEDIEPAGNDENELSEMDSNMNADSDAVEDSDPASNFNVEADSKINPENETLNENELSKDEEE